MTVSNIISGFHRAGSLDKPSLGWIKTGGFALLHLMIQVASVGNCVLPILWVWAGIFGCLSGMAQRHSFPWSIYLPCEARVGFFGLSPACWDIRFFFGPRLLQLLYSAFSCMCPKHTEGMASRRLDHVTPCEIWNSSSDYPWQHSSFSHSDNLQK